jgi:inhibitor of KinA
LASLDTTNAIRDERMQKHLFEVDKFPPCFAVAGDKLKFEPVTLKEYNRIKKEVESGIYEIESEING